MSAATDSVLGRRVAIKLLHAPGSDGLSRRLVVNEARAMAGLRHPNVCRMHEVVLDTIEPGQGHAEAAARWRARLGG